MDLVEFIVKGGQNMKILDDTLQYYADQILCDFKKSETYKRISDEAGNLNCKIIVNCDKSLNITDKNITSLINKLPQKA